VLRIKNCTTHQWQKSFYFFLRFNWNQRRDSVVILVWDDITNSAISKVLDFDPL